MGLGSESVGHKELFETINLGTLETWVLERRQEDLHIDFKTLRDAPILTKDDRKVFAKAVSGFANSDGGIIAWGIDARPDNDVDAAVALIAIPGVASVLSKLQSLTGEVTSPVVGGVEHRIIAGADPGKGFALTLVPASDSGPHMALMGEGRYYKRSGDSFYRMEHFDVADMFGRRRKPELEFRLRPQLGSSSSGPNGRQVNLNLVIQLVNVGRGTARFPMVRFAVGRPYAVSEYELDGNRNPGLPRRTATSIDQVWRTYAGGSDQVIHPGTSLDVTLINQAVHEEVRQLPDLTVDYLVSAENSEVRDWKRWPGWPSAMRRLSKQPDWIQTGYITLTLR